VREVLDSAERAGLCEVVVRTNCTAGDLDRLSVETDIDFQGNIWNVVHSAPSLGITADILDAPAERPGIWDRQRNN
jgi:hypothetical protein